MTLTCDICRSSETILSEDPIQCLKCDTVAHISACCKQFQKVSPDPWTCDPCQLRTSAEPLTCSLCRRTDEKPFLYDDGYMNKDQDALGRGWVHAICFYWEYTAVKNRNIEISQDEKCSYCQLSSGSTVRCFFDHCGQQFHVSCAHRNDALWMRPCAMNSRLLQIFAGCPRHNWIQSFDTATWWDQLLQNQYQKEIVLQELKTCQKLWCGTQDKVAVLEVLKTILDLLLSDCIVVSSFSTSDQKYDLKGILRFEWARSRVECLCKYYGLDASNFKVEKLVDCAKLRDTLLNITHPSDIRFLGQILPGPNCIKCNEPFHEHQHVFYCKNKSHPHHWHCAMLSSSATNDSKPQKSQSKSMTKANLIKVVCEDGTKRIQEPQALTFLSPAVTLQCSACKSMLDCRAIAIQAHVPTATQRISQYVEGGKIARICSTIPAQSNFTDDDLDGASSQLEDTIPMPATAKLDLSLQKSAITHRVDQLNAQRIAKWLGYVITIIQLYIIKNEADHEGRFQTASSTQIPRFKIDVQSADKQLLLCYNKAREMVHDIDHYAYQKLEEAQKMHTDNNGLPVSLLHHLVKEYTCVLYSRHAKALEKKNLEKKPKSEGRSGINGKQKHLSAKTTKRNAKKGAKDGSKVSRKKI